VQTSADSEVSGAPSAPLWVGGSGSSSSRSSFPDDDRRGDPGEARQGVRLVVGAGAVLALVLLAAVPPLARVPLGVGVTLAIAAVVATLVVAVLGPRGRVTPAGAMRLGISVTVASGIACALAATGLALARRIVPSEAVAAWLVATGMSSGVAAAFGVLTWRFTKRAADRAPEEGVPLRIALAGAAGGLALAAWAVAAGHVLGQRIDDAARQSYDEARDLAAIAVATAESVGELDPPTGAAPGSRIAESLAAFAPALGGGWLAIIDADGRVLDKKGQPTGARVEAQAAREITTASPAPLVDDKIARCSRSPAEYPLPCAIRRLDGTRRVVAAIPPRRVRENVLFGFILLGALVVAGATGIGLLLGLALARDLERIAETLDDLRRGARKGALPLDRPLVPASPDEVGELTAALGRLRARLRPIVDDYRLALERATAANKKRDEFLALVSVELRSPLNQVISSAEALLSPTRSDPLTREQEEDVRTILSASRHLTELIDEVLDISAIATGQVHLRLTEVDVAAVAAEIVKAQRPLVQKKGLEIHVDVPSPTPLVRADEKRVRQVLTNLISNAVKFTDEGRVDVSVSRPLENGRVRISVVDTGPGIPETQLGNLFREFVQLGSLKQRAHGTGLGLAICKRLVEAHGGEVSATSIVGKGSTFAIELPVHGPRGREDLDDTPVRGVEEFSA
jgi:signal transduction histidine kinase